MHGVFTVKVKSSFLRTRHEMEEPSIKYILLRDRVGHAVEKNILSLGLTTKSTPMQVLRGEVFEGVPEFDQPTDSTKVAVVGIERKSLRLECPTEDMARLSEEESNLLLAISSSEGRYQTYIDRNRLALGRQLSVGSSVFVEVKGNSKVLPGAVWYKGVLPPSLGTWFGVELIKHPGSGTCDGTFRNKRYFICEPDSGVFVGLDKLTPRDNEDDLKSSKIAKKDENIGAKIRSSLKDSISSFWKGKHEQRSFQEIDGVLKTDERVVTFINDSPARGTVRYTGKEVDSTGNVYIVVGLELDERVGCGTGKRFRSQMFVCKRDYAAFVPLTTVIPEKDFDDNSGKAAKQEAWGKREQIHEDEMYARSMGCVNVPSGTSVESARKLRRTNSMTSAETELMMAAGESSKTDPKEFIEKQRQMLREFEGQNLPDNQDNDVIMHDEERTDSAGNIHFEDDHFKNTPQDRFLSDGIITVQPGLSNGDHNTNLNYLNSTQEYSEYVHLERDGSETENRQLKRAEESKERVQPASHLTSHQSPTSEDEVKQFEQGINRTNGSVVTAKFVSERKTSEIAEAMEVEMEREMTSKDTSEEPYAHSHAPTLPRADLAVDKGTGGNGIMSVDNHYGLEVGSMVEVPMADGVPRYGVIRWMGSMPQVKEKLVAGLELEVKESACSDGTFNKERYFTCPAGRGFFVLLEHCRPDSRFANSPTTDVSLNAEKDFGSELSPEISGVTMPPKTLEDNHRGQMRGLQGHHNSCYLDATLFSMFAFTSVFDTLLHRRKKDDDLEEYDKVQSVLRNLIVNPLRVKGFVRADRLLTLRHLLDQLSSTAGLTNEEKDPEEFLNSLLQQVLKADPFLHLKPRDVQEKKGEGAFLYQIITDKDESVKIAQVQTMLEQSFISADLILSEVPSCLILQMPRFGNRYKMYDMILPNLELDVTHIVENVPRECTMCGSDVAQYECKKCYQKGLLKDGPGIASYCKGCHEKVHGHRNRQDHNPKPILLPRVYGYYSDQKKTGERQITFLKQKMDLFAVVCIETSHYVAFVKCGMDENAPWCFFDSMADRKGERNGYNIPAVTPCPEALEWLSKTPEEIIAAKERGEMPEKVRRLLGDGYLCMYQNLDMTMYK